MNPDTTMILPSVIGFCADRWELKCIWLVLQVSSVNQALSASVIVRPNGCW